MVEIDSPEQFAVALSVMIMHYALLMMMIFAEICTNTLGNCHVVSYPRNKAVVAAQPMEMECITAINSIVRQWEFERHSDKAKFKILTNWGQGPPTLNPDFAHHFRFNINRNGSGVIYTNSTDFEDAGIYTCFLRVNEQILKYSAALIVLETEPVCSSNSTFSLNAKVKEETHAWMRCTVNFKGHLVPDIEWRQHEGHGEAYVEGRNITNLAISEIQNSSISSELTVFLTLSNSSFSYTCKVYFQSANVVRMTNATNAPDYSYIWKTAVEVVSSNTHSHNDLTNIMTIASVTFVAVLSVAVIIICISRRKSLNTEPPTEVTSVASKQEASTPYSNAGPVTFHPRKPNYFGEDGTEYMEVNAMVRQQMPVRPPTKPNIFSVVEEYACIDHTLAPPIPLRGK